MGDEKIIMCLGCGKRISIAETKEHSATCKAAEIIQFVRVTTAKQEFAALTPEEWQEIEKALTKAQEVKQDLPTKEPEQISMTSTDLDEVKIDAKEVLPAKRPTPEPAHSKPLKRCPSCLFHKLLWIPGESIYECQYYRCQHKRFTEQELKEIERIRNAPTQGVSWSGNEYWHPKKKKWCKG